MCMCVCVCVTLKKKSLLALKKKFMSKTQVDA